MPIQDYTPGTQTFTPTTISRIQQYNAANNTNVGVNMPGDVLPATATTTTSNNNTTTTSSNGIKTVVGSFVDAQGNLILIWSDGTTTNTGINNGQAAAQQAAKQSAWAVLQNEFSRYGLGDLVNSLKDIIMQGASGPEMLLKLRSTDAYKVRFAANDVRIKNGYRALSEAEYVGLEDAYANLMRKYGLPDWYTQQGKYGKQANLENFIANDVSPAELEDRIQLGVQRIQQGPKEVLDTLRNFYPGITNGDVLAYVLDPKKALPVLQRQVQTAEIGAEATRYGLNADKTQSDLLAGLGVNQQQARSGYQAIGSGLERGRALSNIYQEPQYDQKTAEQEIFGMNNANEANRRRRKLVGLEQASFGGSSGVRGGALDANRSGSI